MTQRTGSVGDDPGAAARAAQWAPTAGRIGVSCSGGGVRSASFCLGGLQALREAGILARAAYLTAVSGGSYIAAGHAVANGPPKPMPKDMPPAADPAERRCPTPWTQGSPEESAFRHHSATIAPTSRVAIKALVRLVNGIFVNAVLLAALGFAVAHPLGWIAGWVHPDLRLGPTATSLVGVRRASLRLDHPAVLGGGVLAGLAWAAYLVRVLGRPMVTPVRRAVEVVGRASIAATALVVVPTLLVPLGIRYLLPVLGLVPTFAATHPTVHAGSASVTAPAAADGTGLEAVPYLLGVAAAAGSAALTWARRAAFARRRVLAPLLPAIVLPPLALIALVQQAAYGAANGPSGTLVGFGVGRSGPPDAVRWLIVVAALVAFGLLVDAHAWSLHPFYKARLNDGYAVQRRTDGTAGPVDYWAGALKLSEFRTAERPPLPCPEGDPLASVVPGVTEAPRAWPAQAGAHPLRVPPSSAATDAGPQIVVCAAANVTEEGFAPPGRKAATFTFSSTEVGGPEVGYVATLDLERILPRRRAQDVTLVAATAISGAAVSPGMGAQTRGSLGRLLALLDIRLGIWLPNPRIVQRLAASSPAARWRGRPGWPWFLAELIGRFKSTARYIYVSDGGHWENLGLVELLRRGCTEVWCLSAAGDGADRFTTLGQAFALARAELGVEVQVDLTPLRAGPSPDAATSADPLVGAGRLAAHGAVLGSIAYPDGTRGRIVIVETALTADLPWAVRAYAEATADFPDVSTGDQLFDHQQFEAYRALGHHQVRQAVAASLSQGRGTTD